MSTSRAAMPLLALLALVAGGTAAYPTLQTAVADVEPPWDPGRPSVAATGSGVVDRLPDVPGYDRSCRQGRGCVFGPAWSDATDAPMSRNGCDTKNDVRRAQMREVVIKPGTNGCVVTAGVITDPYDGTVVRYARGQQPAAVQIDHVIPLAWAWNAGAAQWPLERRATFANDPSNLQVTGSQTNRAKSDKGPGEWADEISEPGRRCAFLRKAAAVVQTYQLSITRDDAAAFARCGITYDSASGPETTRGKETR